MDDWICLVQSGYDLSGSLDTWLGRVVDASAPLLDVGGGVVGIAFDASGAALRMQEVAIRGGVPELRDFVLAANRDAVPDAITTVYRSGSVAGTLSESVFAAIDGTGERFEAANRGRYRDSMGVVAATGDGGGVALSTPLPARRAMTPAERWRWSRVAAHLGAGLRLRRSLESAAPEGPDVEAVLSPAGRVVDARAGAERPAARERLRHAVLERERALRGRCDADEALSLWEALVQGRWSIVDRFDTDGRRFVVARRNDLRFADLRGLTLRERQVAAFVGLGRSTKEIAYLLGVGDSAVGRAASRAQAKLGLRSRAELASFFAPGGLCARLCEAEIAGEPLALGSYPIFDPGRLSGLTEAERDVAVALLRGETNDEIARRRGSAPRTVANQVRSIFEKFGVHSRAELAGALLRERD